MKTGKKRILSGVVALSLSMVLTVPAMAAVPTGSLKDIANQTATEETTAPDSNITTSFSDVPSTHWAYSAITNMTQKGLFSGTTTPVNGVGVFAPDKTMSRAEFITVVVRYLYKSELDAMPKSDDVWYANAYQVAINHNLLTTGDLDGGDLSKQMTRQEMSMVLVRAATIKGEGPEQILDTSRIPDYSTIGTAYKDFVVKSYSMGLLCGTDTKGTFSPTGTLSRGQAATVLYRLVDPSTRQVPDFNKTPTVETGTLNQNDPNRRTALAGDTFIDSKGNSVVLVLDAKSGVLGANQGVATDLGRKVANGTVAHGFQISSNECDNPYYSTNTTDHATFTGQTYYVNPFNQEGHWNGDWSKISQTYRPTTAGSFDGQLDSTKNFYWDEVAKSWGLVYENTEFVQSVNPTGKQ